MTVKFSIDLDICTFGSSRNIFKKIETAIHVKTLVTSTNQTTSWLLKSQMKKSCFFLNFLISSKYIDLDIHTVGSSKNIFKKMVTPIHDKTQVTCTSQTTSSLLKSQSKQNYFSWISYNITKTYSPWHPYSWIIQKYFVKNGNTNTWLLVISTSQTTSWLLSSQSK